MALFVLSSHLAPVAAGLLLGAGLVLVAVCARDQFPDFSARVAQGSPAPAPRGPTWAGLVRLWGSRLLDSLGSTTRSVERRLELAGSPTDAVGFRAAQAGAGVAGLCAGALAASPAMAGRGGRGVAGIVVVALLGCAVGMSAWDRLLTARAGSRQRRVEAAVPDASELLALAVGAGESVPAALDRVASLSHSDLGDELARAVADIRLGAPSARALTDLAARNDSPALSRLCQTLSTAIERGSPLAAVLHDQARDIREASRQRLMEEGGKREIAMLFPVVFLILPVTVLFALYPGLMALDITL